MSWDILAAVAVPIAIASAFSIATAILSRTLRWVLDRRRTSSLDTSRELQNPDLIRLGSTLVDDLGAVSISSYARHGKVRREFTKALDEIRDYLSLDSSENPPIEGAHEPEIGSDQPDSRLRTAFRQVQSGETWNALAIMRRELELDLLGVLGEERMSLRIGAGQLVNLAARRGLVSSDMQSQLRYAVHVANRAIHGEPVSSGEAEEALVIVDRFFSREEAEERTPKAPQAEA